jgi:hypothetical protein
VNREAGRALQYYGERYGIEQPDYIVGDIDISAIDEFVGYERVWVMFSHISFFQSSEIDTFLNNLEDRGRKIDFLTTTNGIGRTYRAGVSLYDLRPKDL